ncbi:cupin domain-containing protein [Natrarchaeobaculum sulfurireducens]|uniref:Cupin domain containing protein n=1 Tax=Natrarchaeobaculum sulfurireducens TaxID=2044521 RepID=A0A346PKF2_9EURY|nr:cupin domain-containing protein [Natrarchaeobaculum sulfurireducens]AXR79997.1 Cupin domain containing protein [Natrarchaeobaculum sulfurireducens]
MTHISITDVADDLDPAELQHKEVLTAGPLTIEVGKYPADSAVPKNSHNEEELYYILSGSGKLRVGDDTHEIKTGDLVYVEPDLEHDFFHITEEITVLIILGPSANPTSYGIREQDK